MQMMSSFCQPPKKAYSHVLISYQNSLDWKMTINTNKTKMLVFNKGGRLKNINIKYNNSSIECVQKYTFVLILVLLQPLNMKFIIRAMKLYLNYEKPSGTMLPKLQHYCIFLITLSDRYSCMALKFWDIFLPVNISTI